MNLLENSAEMQQVRENLFNLLNSKDEASVAVGVNILWNLVIPDDWVFFLFDKAKRSSSITSLLRKHFPEKEFEAAHIWFSLYEDYERAKNFYHLSKIPNLHKELSWEKLLKSFIVPLDYPYFRGGTFSFLNLSFEQRLFCSPYIPKEELIRFHIGLV
jgi:hypothetical protein